MKLDRQKFSELSLILENTKSFCRWYKQEAPSKTYGQRRSWIGEFIWANRADIGINWATSITVEDRDQLRRYFDKLWDIPMGEINKYAHIPNVWEDPPEAKVDPYAHLRQAIRDGRNVQCWDEDDGWYDLNRDPTNPNRVFGADPSEYRVDPYSLPARPSPTTSEAPMANTFFNQSPTPKEHSMPITKSPIITVTTKTFVNDEDIAGMPDAQVYNLIAQQEADIKELEKIEAKPKKLVAEIEKRKAGIAALVAHLDSKE